MRFKNVRTTVLKNILFIKRFGRKLMKADKKLY